jgi:alanyl-tRNA synthetase
MALHTGQHVLSAALLEVARGETVSARLGETGCTIDIDQPKGLPERELAAAEALANAVIDDDLEVRAFFPSPDELAGMKLRREPKVDDHVRVVRIGDFDTSPCGGTHCTRSAQIGFIRVLGLERYKGKHRIHFEAGARARALTSRDSGLLRALGVSFACGPAEVPEAVERLRGELKASRRALEDVQAELAGHTAAALIAQAAGGPIVAELASLELVRALAKRLAAEPGVVAFLAARAEAGLDIVVVRGPGSSFDCGAFVKRVTAQTGGRGGGRPERAEGRLPPGVDFRTLATA